MDLRTTFAAAVGFEAARRLAGLPPGDPASRLHGHSFQLRLRSVLPAGWADYPGGELAQLQAALAAAVAPLDHQCLNDVLAQPDDLALAQWLHQRLTLPGATRLTRPGATRLALPGPTQLALRSHPERGVDLDADGSAQLWRRYAFQSAHQLPNVPPGHPCGRLHGHGFEVVLHVALPAAEAAPPTARALDQAWAPLHAQLDHVCLNELPGLHNPTSELLSSWLWAQLRPTLPALCGVTVHETGSSGAHYDGEHYRIWKDMTLDSALQLRRAPPGHPKQRVHGHTYRLRLHLLAPLDALMGWTQDFGDVKRLFQPIFQALDHQPLHQIADLADCDSATLAAWILAKASPALPQLNRVDLYETAGQGAIVHRGACGLPLPV